ncbi:MULTISPECIES: glycosyltransferase family protein [Paenibacillus]|uniref:glycosyltransferase n=1 Tax=Paenibacillus TaxID=44249 RepID=UPI0022B8CCBC|nr:glycosyltransferase [Paenibacillus caseinilyticus]MCZ8520827.1 glycosyltransferase [Paenibacillus caseinilyticus]
MAVVIYPKTLSWSYMKQRPQQLMTHLGKLGHKVYFENPAPIEEQFTEVEPNVYLFTDAQRFIGRELPRLRGSERVVVWTTWAKQRTRIPLFRPDGVIYDCCDEFPQWARYEAPMVGYANHVVCSAEVIRQRLELAYPEKGITLIRNAADERFLEREPLPRPADLPHGPVVGYIGAWAYWVDHPLVMTMARWFPQVQFVSIGAAYGEVPTYEEYPNVHVLGERPHEALQAYLQHFDAALIPFRYHPITLATNPVKAYEYLASGVRVLSTALPECVAMHPHVVTATTHEDFGWKLGKLLSEADSEEAREQRAAYAYRNRWEVRARQADALIRSI